MKLPMSLWELAIGAVICIIIGFAAAYNRADNRLDDCVIVAEQRSNYGPTAAQAYYFAQCVKPKKYGPSLN